MLRLLQCAVVGVVALVQLFYIKRSTIVRCGFYLSFHAAKIKIKIKSLRCGFFSAENLL